MRLLPPTWKRPAGLRFRVPGWSQLRQWPVSMMLACLFAALGSVQMTFLIGNSLYRSYVWSAEHRQIEAEVRGLNVDVRVLRETQAHATDPEELRAQARCLGFVDKSETVVVANDAPEGSGNNCDPVRMP